jgi:hypothetical protein
MFRAVSACTPDTDSRQARWRDMPKVGGGTPFFTALDYWVDLNLVETRTFPGGVLLTQVRDQALNGAVSGQPTISWPSSAS